MEVGMKVETLHSPHGTPHKPHGPRVEPYVCPKCYVPFETLFVFGKHVREAHEERRGL